MISSALQATKLPLAVTMGEPAGIGGEITLSTWLRHRESIPPFFCIDDLERLDVLARRLGWPVPVREIGDPDEAVSMFPSALPVLPIHLPVPVSSGRPRPENAVAVRGSIERAVELTVAGKAGAVVTNPIQKKTLKDAGFEYPGHTEYLAAISGSAQPPLMMLAGPGLRVVPVTVHVSLREALDSLTRDAIIDAAEATAIALRQDFGIANPRLAIAGLNPHAGEEGVMGREEIDIIAPAIRDLFDRGVGAFGPVPPDALFTTRARIGYDAAICMYHDQGLIPIKALVFDETVNITLGLPFVRTSPDHGTALDIAGTGKANPASLIAALHTADQMAARRRAAT